MDFSNWLWLIPISPLLGAVINGIFGKRLSKSVIGIIGAGTVALSFLISLGAFLQMLRTPDSAMPIVRNYFAWIQAGDVSGEFRIPARSSVRPDDSDRDRRRISDSRLLHRLHARRFRVLSILRLPEPVHVLHAHARSREQLPADVRRLGRRRTVFVSADRVLVRQEIRNRRREEGIHRQPRRRFRIHPGNDADFLDVQVGRLRSGFRGCRIISSGTSRDDRDADGDLPADVCRRHRKVRADSAVRLAAGRDGRPDAGQRTDSCGDDGYRRAFI